jgi:hypothetical protein
MSNGCSILSPRSLNLTLDDIRLRLSGAKKLKVGTSSIWRFYDRHEITFKKTLHAAEQDRPDVAAARAALKAEQPSLKAPRLVFIDETAVTTKMVRHYGRSPRGERLVASVPHGHWKTLTFIAALRFDPDLGRVVRQKAHGLRHRGRRWPFEPASVGRPRRRRSPRCGERRLVRRRSNKLCVRVREGREVLQTVIFDRGCFACMLGGSDRRTWRPMACSRRHDRRAGQVLTGMASAPSVVRP